MKKNLYALLLLLAIGFNANAQFNYNFSTRQETYQDLSGSTSVNDTTRWDDDLFRVPIGFNFSLGGKTIIDISTDGSFIANDSSGIISGFMVTDIDIHDRGNAGGTSSESPISYVTVGTTPNRIFKFEVKNAGMYDEYDIYATNDDSLSYQVWLYEIDNAVEIHYGRSKITHPADYYYLSGYPMVGYMKNFSSTNISFDNFYFLQGSASAPVIDSASNFFTINGGLNTFPPNGTVYRFAPIPVGINGVAKGDVQVSLLSNVGRNYIQLQNNTTSSTTYKVFGMNGAQMNVNGTLQQGTNKVDISNLASGIYIVHVQNEHGGKAFKITKL